MTKDEQFAYQSYRCDERIAARKKITQPLDVWLDFADTALRSCFDLSLSEISVRNRARTLVDLRRVVIFAAFDLGYSCEKVAYEIGGRDHASILHSYKTSLGLLEVDRELKLMFSEFVKEMLMLGAELSEDSLLLAGITPEYESIETTPPRPERESPVVSH